MAPIQPVTRDVYDQSMFTVSTSHSDAVDSEYKPVVYKVPHTMQL